MRKEIWRPVVGFEGLYEVSNYGNVASLNYRNTGKRHLLKPLVHPCGYKTIHLWKDRVRERTKTIHRIVWEAFNGEIPEGMQINHIDENKENNCLWNLNLMTAKENTNWGTHNERCSKANLNNPKMSKSVIALDEDGNIVMEFPSASEAERNGFDCGNVSKSCRGCYRCEGNHKYKGLNWYYK